jgi:hypothetical protein
MKPKISQPRRHVLNSRQLDVTTRGEKGTLTTIHRNDALTAETVNDLVDRFGDRLRVGRVECVA